jgi:hypothetical protein
VGFDSALDMLVSRHHSELSKNNPLNRVVNAVKKNPGREPGLSGL